MNNEKKYLLFLQFYSFNKLGKKYICRKKLIFYGIVFYIDDMFKS